MDLIHAVSDRIFCVTPSWRGASDQPKFSRRMGEPKTLYRLNESTSLSKTDFRHSFLQGTQASYFCPSVSSSRWRWESSIVGMTMTGQKRNLEKNLSQCHSVYHMPYIDWPAIEPRPQRCKAGDYLTEIWHGWFKDLYLAWITFKGTARTAQ